MATQHNFRVHIFCPYMDPNVDVHVSRSYELAHISFNKLTLHPLKKLSSFYFIHLEKKVNLNNICITINNTPISRVQNIELLGVI